MIRTVVLVVAVVGCAPLSSERLRPPPTSKPPKVDAPVVAEWKPIEKCDHDFHAPARQVRVDHVVGDQLATEAHGTMAKAKVKDGLDPTIVRDAIDTYGNALRKDPYNAETTLDLAIAYDAVYRKGCAIALLERLAVLETNPGIAKDASTVIGRVVADSSLFPRYRNEAKHAVGR